MHLYMGQSEKLWTFHAPVFPRAATYTYYAQVKTRIYRL